MRGLGMRARKLDVWALVSWSVEDFVGRDGVELHVRLVAFVKFFFNCYHDAGISAIVQYLYGGLCMRIGEVIGV